jgi:hypothetical protein
MPAWTAIPSITSRMMTRSAGKPARVMKGPQGETDDQQAEPEPAALHADAQILVMRRSGPGQMRDRGIRGDHHLRGPQAPAEQRRFAPRFLEGWPQQVAATHGFRLVGKHIEQAHARELAGEDVTAPAQWSRIIRRPMTS